MTRKIHIVGNWKMNHNQKEIQSFFNVMRENKNKYDCNAWVAPQAIHVQKCIELGNDLGIKVGVQNLCDHEKGAFTGELSPKSVKDIGAHFAIIGHSERRHIYGEQDKLLNDKTKLALENGLTVIFCVGEKLEDRESGKTNEVISRQILEGMKNIPENSRSNIIIAYEPVWAIGTGKTASPEQAQEVHQYIRNELLNQVGFNKDETIILYGGSVKPSNVKELVGQNDIDGALVGGASLKGEDFIQLC